MDVILLFKSIVGLAVILGILVLVLILPKRLQKQKREEQARKKKLAIVVETKDDVHALEVLHAIIKRKVSTTEELKDALDLILKYHPNIHKKLGIRTHPDSDIYMDVIFKLCRHQNTNKTITIKFINELEKLNSDYKKEINDAMMRGLNSRGI
jgi:hypothetical protein